MDNVRVLRNKKEIKIYDDGSSEILPAKKQITYVVFVQQDSQQDGLVLRFNIRAIREALVEKEREKSSKLDATNDANKEYQLIFISEDITKHIPIEHVEILQNLKVVRLRDLNSAVKFTLGLRFKYFDDNYIRKPFSSFSMTNLSRLIEYESILKRTNTKDLLSYIKRCHAVSISAQVDQKYNWKSSALIIDPLKCTECNRISIKQVLKKMRDIKFETRFYTNDRFVDTDKIYTQISNYCKFVQKVSDITACCNFQLYDADNQEICSVHISRIFSLYEAIKDGNVTGYQSEEDFRQMLSNLFTQQVNDEVHPERTQNLNGQAPGQAGVCRLKDYPESMRKSKPKKYVRIQTPAPSEDSDVEDFISSWNITKPSASTVSPQPDAANTRNPTDTNMTESYNPEIIEISDASGNGSVSADDEADKENERPGQTEPSAAYMEEVNRIRDYCIQTFQTLHQCATVIPEKTKGLMTFYGDFYVIYSPGELYTEAEPDESQKSEIGIFWDKYVTAAESPVIEEIFDEQPATEEVVLVPPDTPRALKRKRNLPETVTSQTVMEVVSERNSPETVTSQTVMEVGVENTMINPTIAPDKIVEYTPGPYVPIPLNPPRAKSKTPMPPNNRTDRELDLQTNITESLIRSSEPYVPIPLNPPKSRATIPPTRDDSPINSRATITQATMSRGDSPITCTPIPANPRVARAREAMAMEVDDSPITCTPIRTRVTRETNDVDNSPITYTPIPINLRNARATITRVANESPITCTPIQTKVTHTTNTNDSPITYTPISLNARDCEADTMGVNESPITCTPIPPNPRTRMANTHVNASPVTCTPIHQINSEVTITRVTTKDNNKSPIPNNTALNNESISLIRLNRQPNHHRELNSQPNRAVPIPLIPPMNQGANDTPITGLLSRLNIQPNSGMDAQRYCEMNLQPVMMNRAPINIAGSPSINACNPFNPLLPPNRNNEFNPEPIRVNYIPGTLLFVPIPAMNSDANINDVAAPNEQPNRQTDAQQYHLNAPNSLPIDPITQGLLTYRLNPLNLIDPMTIQRREQQIFAEMVNNMQRMMPHPVNREQIERVNAHIFANLRNANAFPNPYQVDPRLIMNTVNVPLSNVPLNHPIHGHPQMLPGPYLNIAQQNYLNFMNGGQTMLQFPEANHMQALTGAHPLNQQPRPFVYPHMLHNEPPPIHPNAMQVAPYRPAEAAIRNDALQRLRDAGVRTDYRSQYVNLSVTNAGFHNDYLAWQTAAQVYSDVHRGATSTRRGRRGSRGRGGSRGRNRTNQPSPPINEFCRLRGALSDCGCPGTYLIPNDADSNRFRQQQDYRIIIEPDTRTAAADPVLPEDSSSYSRRRRGRNRLNIDPPTDANICRGSNTEGTMNNTIGQSDANNRPSSESQAGSNPRTLDGGKTLINPSMSRPSMESDARNNSATNIHPPMESVAPNANNPRPYDGNKTDSRTNPTINRPPMASDAPINPTTYNRPTGSDARNKQHRRSFDGGKKDSDIDPTLNNRPDVRNNPSANNRRSFEPDLLINPTTNRPPDAQIDPTTNNRTPIGPDARNNQSVHNRSFDVSGTDLLINPPIESNAPMNPTTNNPIGSDARNNPTMNNRRSFDGNQTNSLINPSRLRPPIKPNIPINPTTSHPPIGSDARINPSTNYGINTYSAMNRPPIDASINPTTNNRPSIASDARNNHQFFDGAQQNLVINPTTNSRPPMESDAQINSSASVRRETDLGTNSTMNRPPIKPNAPVIPTINRPTMESDGRKNPSTNNRWFFDGNQIMSLINPTRNRPPIESDAPINPTTNNRPPIGSDAQNNASANSRPPIKPNTSTNPTTNNRPPIGSDARNNPSVNNRRSIHAGKTDTPINPIMNNPSVASDARNNLTTYNRPPMESNAHINSSVNNCRSLDGVQTDLVINATTNNRPPMESDARNNPSVNNRRSTHGGKTDTPIHSIMNNPSVASDAQNNLTTYNPPKGSNAQINSSVNNCRSLSGVQTDLVINPTTNSRPPMESDARNKPSVNNRRSIHADKTDVPINPIMNNPSVASDARNNLTTYNRPPIELNAQINSSVNNCRSLSGVQTDLVINPTTNNRPMESDARNNPSVNNRRSTPGGKTDTPIHPIMNNPSVPSDARNNLTTYNRPPMESNAQINSSVNNCRSLSGVQTDLVFNPTTNNRPMESDARIHPSARNRPFDGSETDLVTNSTTNRLPIKSDARINPINNQPPIGSDVRNNPSTNNHRSYDGSDTDLLINPTRDRPRIESDPPINPPSNNRPPSGSDVRNNPSTNNRRFFDCNQINSIINLTMNRPPIESDAPINPIYNRPLIESDASINLSTSTRRSFDSSQTDLVINPTTRPPMESDARNQMNSPINLTRNRTPIKSDAPITPTRNNRLPSGSATRYRPSVNNRRSFDGRRRNLVINPTTRKRSLKSDIRINPFARNRLPTHASNRRAFDDTDEKLLIDLTIDNQSANQPNDSHANTFGVPRRSRSDKSIYNPQPSVAHNSNVIRRRSPFGSYPYTSTPTTRDGYPPRSTHNRIYPQRSTHNRAYPQTVEPLNLSMSSPSIEPHQSHRQPTPMRNEHHESNKRTGERFADFTNNDRHPHRPALRTKRKRQTAHRSQLAKKIRNNFKEMQSRAETEAPPTEAEVPGGEAPRTAAVVPRTTAVVPRTAAQVPQTERAPPRPGTVAPRPGTARADGEAPQKETETEAPRTLAPRPQYTQMQRVVRTIQSSVTQTTTDSNVRQISIISTHDHSTPTINVNISTDAQNLTGITRSLLQEPNAQINAPGNQPPTNISFHHSPGYQHASTFQNKHYPMWWPGDSCECKENNPKLVQENVLRHSDVNQFILNNNQNHAKNPMTSCTVSEANITNDAQQKRKLKYEYVESAKRRPVTPIDIKEDDTLLV